MKRKLRFKDDIPKFVWLGNRNAPRLSTEIEYSDNSIIYVSDAPNYASAMERIYNNSKYLQGKDVDKYMFAMVQFLDDEDEDVFYLMLHDFNEWHEILDMDWYKNETKE